jgi:hypothetical protein
MSIYQTLTLASIDEMSRAQRWLNSFPAYVAERDARLEADGAAYRHERRLKAIRRYLRERAARKGA